MEVLLMYMEDHQRFDSAKMKESLRSLEHVVEINEGDLIGADIVCRCDDDTMVHMSQDCEFLAVRGHEKESLKFALELQKNYGSSFHLTDEGGHFDIIIDGNQELEEISSQLIA